MDPPQAPAATPHMALKTFPMQIMGKKKTGGSNVAVTSSVIPTSTDTSANILHRLQSLRNRDDAA
jgi:hypothetical protein